MQSVAITLQNPKRLSALEPLFSAQGMATVAASQASDVPDDVAAVVVDVTGDDPGQAAQRLRTFDLGVPILAVFSLPKGVAYRTLRADLLAAGAADVIEHGGPPADLVMRVVALCRKSEQPSVLIVDDDPKILAWAAEELQRTGLRVQTADTLSQARAVFQTGPIDALVVDRMLPDGDGLSFVAELRKARIATPALIYTAMTDIADRVAGLEQAGADDYLCKPAHADELRARVRVLLRPRISADHLIFGPLALSRHDRTVRWRGNRVDLRPRETDVLIYLAERNGLPIPQQMLYMDIWEKLYMEPDSNPVSATKFRLLNNLRSFVKTRGESLPDFLHTDGGSYVFRPEPLLALTDPAAPDDPV